MTVLHVILERGGLIADFKCDGDAIAKLDTTECSEVLIAAYRGAVDALAETEAHRPNCWSRIPIQ